MLFAQPGLVGLVRLERAKILNAFCYAGAPQKMAGRMLVPTRSATRQGKVDQRPKCQGGSKGIFGCKRICSPWQNFILIPIQLRRALDDEVGGPIQGRPGDEEEQCMHQASGTLGMIERPLLRLDVVEIR